MALTLLNATAARVSLPSLHFQQLDADDLLKTTAHSVTIDITISRGADALSTLPKRFCQSLYCLNRWFGLFFI